MSVIFHLINKEIRVVPFELLASSKVLGAVLSDLRLKDDIELDVKLEFTEAFHFYVDFLLGHKPTIFTAEELVQCLAIEDYYEDKEFLIYLVSQAYKFWSTIFPYLPDDDEVWLRTPHEFVPSSLRNQEKFFNDWLAINANKEVVLDGNRVYHTDLTYYDEGRKQKREVDIYHTVNEEEVGYFFKVGWYDNPSIQGGQAEYRYIYKDGKLDGLQERWYEDGRPKYRHNYKDDEPDGLQEGWYADGQAKYRDNYKDGMRDGLQEDWYENGQPKYRINYKDGKPDGLQEGWYENGQDKYVKEYGMGKLISEKNF